MNTDRFDMSNHEEYTNWRPQQPIGKASIQTETFYSDTSRTVVESPIVQMQAGLPAQIPVIRPKRIMHPHFVVSGEQDLDPDDIPALQADTAEGRFITDVFTEEHEEQFTHQEIDHLAEIAVDGLNTGWQALDVWE